MRKLARNSILLFIFTFLFFSNSSLASAAIQESSNNTDTLNASKVSGDYGPNSVGTELIAEGVGYNKSKSISFDMDVFWFFRDHNAFETIVSRHTSGKYKIKITGSNGYSWTSSEHSGNDVFTTTNCKKGVTYTVKITSTSKTEDLNCYLRLKSYN